jgi:hypothetical protein
MDERLANHQAGYPTWTGYDCRLCERRNPQLNHYALGMQSANQRYAQKAIDNRLEHRHCLVIADSEAAIPKRSQADKPNSEDTGTDSGSVSNQRVRRNRLAALPGEIRTSNHYALCV